MSFIETNPLKNSTIMLIYSEREEIKLDPEYQRMGDVWTLEKKQLLIDSILNNYDIPKIYFHTYNREQRERTKCSYSVIDGRQRLETIWGFIKGEFPLSDDFEYQKDDSVKISKFFYDDIAKEYPRIRIQFDSFVLPIVGISTDDEELIEDMFSRLNEAVPLNAAEKRNAKTGFAAKAIREVAETKFFQKKVRFSNKRFQHLEVSARLILTEWSLFYHQKLIDTKKVYLDKFVEDYSNKPNEVNELKFRVTAILDVMAEIFADSDTLLRAQGNMVLYYLIARNALERNEFFKFSRSNLLEFRESLNINRKNAEQNYSESLFELLEFDRLSQQGTNDASNIRDRYKTLAKFLNLHTDF